MRRFALAALATLLAIACARTVGLEPLLGGAPRLRVGTSGDYAPFALDGAGFDVDVAERMAEDLGYAIQWVPFRWPELAERVRRGDFDLVMSGVTWRPERDVAGFLTRAVAAGGPCLVGAATPARVAVNRGGALERWARARLARAEIVAVDDNRSLGERFARGDVDAFVTDSFEIAHLAAPEWPRRCEPPRERKVYWVAPARAGDLGPALERWLATREPELDALRARWLGGSAPRDGVEHAIDLVARRIALMPAVGAWKRARGEPIADPEREARVLERAREDAIPAGLEPSSVQALFRLQIELASAVQARTAEASTLELETELRPAISRIGTRLVAALAEVAPIGRDELPLDRLALLEPLLSQAEQAAVQRALLAVRPGVDARAPRDFLAPEANTGREAYSAWFGASDGRTLYFGLSPFWTLWWQSGGDASAELREPGDHLIGRFDLARERFLPPLRVRQRSDASRGSVWDVLVHSSGRIWYTTFHEEIGSVRADGSDPQRYTALGSGWNELAEGPHGNVYATRYGDGSGRHPAGGGGSIGVIAPDGSLLREHPIPGPPDGFAAPKSLAVDPKSGEVRFNTDTFGARESLWHESIRLAPDGRVLERSDGPEELLFPAYDARGRAWLALRVGGRLRVRVVAQPATVDVDLGPIAADDFAQELVPTADGGALVSRWSGRVQRLRPAKQAFAVAEVPLELPEACRPPTGRSVLYTPALYGERVYATLFCGARVLRAGAAR